MNMAAQRLWPPGLSSLLLLLLLQAGLLPWPAEAEPFAYVALQDINAVAVIDTVRNEVASTIAVDTEPAQVAASPDGSRIYVTNLGSDTVSVIATASGTVVATIAVGGRPWGIDVAPDGRQVYVANFGSGSISVIDTASETTVATVTVGAQPGGVAVSPDGSYIWVAHWDIPSITIIDAATLTPTSLTFEDLPYGTPSLANLVLSDDGSRIFVSAFYDGNASILVIDTTSGIITDIVQIGGHYAQGIAVSPDSNVACVAAESGIFRIDLDTLSISGSMGGIFDDAFELAYAPDGSRVYVTHFNDMDGIAYLLVIDTASHTLLTAIPLPGFGLGVAVASVASVAKLHVAIDIKPGRTAAALIPDSSGSVPAAILATANFAAPDLVDPASLQLAGAEVRSVGRRQKRLCHAEDVNGDGFNDLLCQFSARLLRLEPGAETVILTGTLYPEYGATPIKGEVVIQSGLAGFVRDN